MYGASIRTRFSRYLDGRHRRCSGQAFKSKRRQNARKHAGPRSRPVSKVRVPSARDSTTSNGSSVQVRRVSERGQVRERSTLDNEVAKRIVNDDAAYVLPCLQVLRVDLLRFRT